MSEESIVVLNLRYRRRYYLVSPERAKYYLGEFDRLGGHYLRAQGSRNQAENYLRGSKNPCLQKLFESIEKAEIALLASLATKRDLDQKACELEQRLKGESRPIQVVEISIEQE